MVPARGTVATLFDRSVVGLVAGVEEIELPETSVGMTVTAVTCGVNTVEEIDSPVDCLEDVGRSSDTHQIDGFVRRKLGYNVLENVVHLLMRFADCESADRVPREIKLPDAACMFHSDIVIYAALIDAEEHLMRVDGVFTGVELAHLVPAAHEPPRSPRHRLGDICLLCCARRTFVKCHRYGRSEVRLDLHALLGAHLDEPSVYVGVKGHSLFFDPAQTGEREHLKSAGVGKDRTVPVHELPKTAHLSHDLVAGTNVEVVGIAKLNLCTEPRKVNRGNGALDGSHSSHIHKNRCFDRTVNGFESGAFGATVSA